MENNIKVFRAHRALSWLYGLIVCVVLLLFSMTPKNGESLGVIIAIVFTISLFFLLHHFIAKGAKEKKGWAKIASVIVGIIMLFGFPLGTMIGIYLLINNSGWESNPIRNT
jgi:predicted MFS family arabinose efflux permease